MSSGGTCLSFKYKFDGMLNQTRTGLPCKLKMEMSKQGVCRLLGFIYFRKVGKATTSCSLALELLKGAGCQYDLWQLDYG